MLDSIQPLSTRPTPSLARLANPEVRGGVRVLIVDDSLVMRRMISDVLAGDPNILVVGNANGGENALQQIPVLKPDVVTMDVEMPGMDGIETLKRIREAYPRIKVVMLSTLTERGAPMTMKALMCGASDYVAKPQNMGSAAEAKEYLRKELIVRIRQFLPVLKRPVTRPGVVAGVVAARLTKNPKALLIGVSTGGPQALSVVLPALPADFPLPILVVQHMPPMFTALLAQRLDVTARIRVAEAKDGQAIAPGLALLAPGNFHMALKKRGTEVRVELNQDPPENSCRPAADVLFRSAAEIWGGDVVAAVLTGMGHDGLRGVEKLKPLGAWVVAQDEASSAVWGMPGSIVQAGLADQVADLSQVVPAILRKVGYKS